MKKLFITGKIEEFESFVNREDIEVLQVDVKGVEQSIMFQQSFIAIVFYRQITKDKENPMDKISQVPSLRNLCWKIDKDVWAKVESGESTTSWGREKTGLLILDFLKEMAENITPDKGCVRCNLNKELCPCDECKYHTKLSQNA